MLSFVLVVFGWSCILYFILFSTGVRRERRPSVRTIVDQVKDTFIVCSVFLCFQWFFSCIYIYIATFLTLFFRVISILRDLRLHMANVITAVTLIHSGLSHGSKSCIRT